MNKALYLIHKILTGFVSVGVLFQLLFAGLWHAEVFNSPEVHILFGLGLLLASLIALIAALAGKMDRSIVAPTAILFFLILLQPILMETRRSGLMPFLSAFHTVNAAFIGMTSGMVAARSRSSQPETAEQAPALSPAAAGD